MNKIRNHVIGNILDGAIRQSRFKLLFYYIMEKIQFFDFRQNISRSLRCNLAAIFAIYLISIVFCRIM